jgi:hypothetical protein
MPTIVYMNVRSCVIRRPATGGIEYHRGILFSDGLVAHCTPRHGAQMITLVEFMADKPSRVIRYLNESEEKRVRRRVRGALRAQRPYDLLNWNCDTFVNWAVDGVPTSRAVRDWLVIGLLAVAVCAIQ